MTYSEAQGIFYINVQIKKLESDLSLAPSSETQARLTKAKEMLQTKVLAFEEFLTTVDDPCMQAILRFRTIDNLTWREIGDLVYMDGSAVRRKYMRYFAKNTTR